MREKGLYNRIYSKEDWMRVSHESVEIFEKYIDHISKKKTPGTVKQYKNDLRIVLILLEKYFPGARILDLGVKEFEALRKILVVEFNMSNARVNRMICVVGKMLDFYYESKGKQTKNRLYGLKGLSNERVKEVYYLSDNQILKLKTALNLRQDFQKACLLSLIYDSCKKRKELFQLGKNFLEKVEEMDMEIFSGGTDALKRYLAVRGEDDIEALWIVRRGIHKRSATYETMYDWYKTMSELLSEIEEEPINITHRSIRLSALKNYEDGSHYATQERRIYRARGKRDDDF